MDMYDYASNEILAEPIKYRHSATIRDSFLNTHKILKSIGSDPKFYIIENDCSSDLKESMKKCATNFQLAPPHMYRQNASEQYIIT